MKPFSTFSDSSGHALIDIQISARGSGEISLTGDPIHFPPEIAERVTTIVSRLLDEQVETFRVSHSSPWATPMEIRSALAAASTEFRGGMIADRPDFPQRPRILISVTVRHGFATAELAFANIDPSNFPAEEIDFLIDRFNSVLGEIPMGVSAFIAGRN